MDINWEKLFQEIANFVAFSRKLFIEAWNQPNAPQLLGIALGTFLLLILIWKIKARRRDIKLFNNNAGTVRVSQRALDELVQSVCYSLGALNRPDVKIYTKRGKLCMKVALRLESGQALTTATDKIQTALTYAFREHLGVEKLGNIDVKIIGFKGLIYKPIKKALPPAEPQSPAIEINNNAEEKGSVNENEDFLNPLFDSDKNDKNNK